MNYGLTLNGTQRKSFTPVAHIYKEPGRFLCGSRSKKRIRRSDALARGLCQVCRVASGEDVGKVTKAWLLPEQVEEVIRLYDNGKGMRQREIGVLFAVSPQTICKYLKDNGITGNRVLPSWEEDQMPQIMDLYWKQRLSQKEVAEVMGIAQKTVSRRMRKHGVLIRLPIPTPDKVYRRQPGDSKTQSATMKAVQEVKRAGGEWVPQPRKVAA